MYIYFYSKVIIESISAEVPSLCSPVLASRPSPPSAQENDNADLSIDEEACPIKLVIRNEVDK